MPSRSRKGPRPGHRPGHHVRIPDDVWHAVGRECCGSARHGILSGSLHFHGRLPAFRLVGMADRHPEHRRDPYGGLLCCVYGKSVENRCPWVGRRDSEVTGQLQEKGTSNIRCPLPQPSFERLKGFVDRIYRRKEAAAGGRPASSSLRATSDPRPERIRKPARRF